MHPLEKKTLKTIEQENLLQTAEKMVIGVSAGPDSMALLHVLDRLAPVLNITLIAVYVNHGLRPDEAEQEKSLVEAQTGRLGVEFVSGSVDVKGLAAKRKLSTEHAARLLRYDFLEKTARQRSAAKIGLAHTADDQAEEILLRLIRGTGRKGLSGMKTLRAGRFIRPFLRFPKSRLLDYLETYSIPFRLDSSNTQDIYLRNRIRNDLLPYLAARYNPDIRETLNRTANILQDEEELLEQITETALEETVTIIPKTAGRNFNHSIPAGETDLQELRLSQKHFYLQPRAIQRRLVEKCCWLMACAPRSRQIENIIQLARPDSRDRSLHLAGGLRVSRNKELLSFSYPQGRGPFRGDLAPATETGLPETSIAAPGCYEFPAVNRKLKVEEIAGNILGAMEIPSTSEYLDMALFSYPLTLRGPQAEDRFHPLGAPGHKKVRDFLIDRKIERSLRATVPVLCADDAILALPGLRIDHRYRITTKTTRALKVSWEAME